MSCKMGQSAVFSGRFLWPRQFVGGWKQNGQNVGMWNNIELEVGGTVWVGGAAMVVVVLGRESNKNYSSPPSHVEIKLSDSGAKWTFKIKDSSTKGSTWTLTSTFGPPPILQYNLDNLSFLSFTRCYIFKPHQSSCHHLLLQQHFDRTCLFLVWPATVNVPIWFWKDLRLDQMLGGSTWILLICV